MPYSYSNLLAERNFSLDKQPVEFIPLWKIVKNCFLNDFKLSALLEIVLPSGIFYFFFLTAAYSKSQILIELTFCTCNEI